MSHQRFKELRSRDGFANSIPHVLGIRASDLERDFGRDFKGTFEKAGFEKREFLKRSSSFQVPFNPLNYFTI